MTCCNPYQFSEIGTDIVELTLHLNWRTAVPSPYYWTVQAQHLTDVAIRHRRLRHFAAFRRAQMLRGSLPRSSHLIMGAAFPGQDHQRCG